MRRGKMAQLMKKVILMVMIQTQDIQLQGTSSRVMPNVLLGEGGDDGGSVIDGELLKDLDKGKKRS